MFQTLKNSLKVALVKQEVYPDLYVCDKQESIKDTLFSSIMRVGPIGLFEIFDTDFIIVDEDKSSECLIWREKHQDQVCERLEKLSSTTIDKLEGSEFKKPGSKKTNGELSVSANAINWNKYHIVISINCSIPTSIVKKHPDVLWCYMIDDAKIYTDKVYFGYDVTLNQMARGTVSSNLGVIDFPYTFTSSNLLQNIMYDYLARKAESKGIYAEINTCNERPVASPPEHYKKLTNLGHSIRIHKQLIKNNLKEVYDAKYFLKIGGRLIRGNSVIEAISLGTVVLMDENDIVHSELIPEEARVKTIDEAMEKIRFLDSNQNKYEQLLRKQKERLQYYIYRCPAESLLNLHKIKCGNLLDKIKVKALGYF